MILLGNGARYFFRAYVLKPVLYRITVVWAKPRLNPFLPSGSEWLGSFFEHKRHGSCLLAERAIARAADERRRAERGLVEALSRAAKWRKCMSRKGNLADRL